MNNIPKLKDAMKYYLSNSGLVMFERFNGVLALADLDSDTSDMTISDSDIKLDSRTCPLINYGFDDTSNLITSIEVKYQNIVPDDDNFGATKYCYRTGDTRSHNFTLYEGGIGVTDLQGYLNDAYETIGEERPYTFEARGIREDSTAERLARLMIQLSYRPMAEVEFHGIYSALSLEIGDKIDFDVTALPSSVKTYGGNQRIFIVDKISLQPNAGSSADLKIHAREIGTANLPVDTEWVDTFNTGTAYTDTMTSGSLKQEVL